jgi:tetratricopeptide (TPR) repeat protein
MLKAVKNRVKARHRLPDYRKQGDAARSRNDWDAASLYYAFHLEKFPNDFAIWVQLGHALKEQGIFDRADLAYGQANRLDQYSADLLLNRGHLSKIRFDYSSALFYYKSSYSIDHNKYAENELIALDELYALTSQVDHDQYISVTQQEALEPAQGAILRSLDVYNGALVDLWQAGTHGTAPPQTEPDPLTAQS